jgi:CspA family cold shock protein
MSLPRQPGPTSQLNKPDASTASGRRSLKHLSLTGDHPMPVGTVKFYNSWKGFGFIQPDDGSQDIYVRLGSLEKAGLAMLSEGHKVSFEITSEGGKNAATDLKIV